MLENYEYPSGYKLKYLYDERGNQHEVRTADAYNTLLCKANAENQRGQLTKATMGNGTVTDFEWDAYGFPQRNKVSKGTNSILQNLTFSFNAATGNLNARSDAKRNNILETFDYDNLLKDRLTYWSATGGSAKTMAYAANGNVLKKTDVSSSSNGYLYETAKPNAVTKVVSPTSSFQQNSLGQTIAYSPSNKVASIYQDVSSPMSGYRTLEITYNAFDQRVYSKYIENLGKTPLQKETFYFDNYEVKKDLPNSQTWYHYLQGPDGLFAIMKQQGSTKTMYYVHKDYLGSLTAISDAAGNLVESLSYDPWGRRRNPNDWNDYNVTSTLFDRGFTGHEHIPQFGLINMNGRVYDPFLARFLSPDPFVQAPGNPQNYNRYTYALNNPLKYTDPSGYTFKPDDWNKGIGGAISYTPMHAGYQGNIGAGSGNHWSDPFMAGSHGYYYDWGSGQYIDYYNGATVSYSTVNTNFIAPHSYSSLRMAETNEGARFYTISMAGKTGVVSTFGTISGIFANPDGAITVVSPGAGTHGFLEDKPMSHWLDIFGVELTVASGQGDGFNWGIPIGAAGTAISAGTEYADNLVRTSFKTGRNPVSWSKLTPKQQAWRTANVLGKNAKYVKYAKGAGVIGTGISVGMAGRDIYMGEGTTIDYFDVGVGTASIGAAIFLASNPVGWVIGTGAAIYFAGRLVYDIYEEVND